MDLPHSEGSVRMLTDRVSLDVLHKFQDRFADLGRVTVCLCRVDGELITPPTWG